MPSFTKHIAVDECLAGDPSRMLDEHYMPRASASDLHNHGQIAGPLSVVDYETGRFPSLRVFHGENREILSNILCLTLTDPYSTHHTSKEKIPSIGAERFLKLSEGERIVLDLMTSEISDILSLLNRDVFSHLQRLGSVSMHIASETAPVTDPLTLITIRPQKLYEFLGEEIRHAYNSVREVATNIYPEQIASQINNEESTLHRAMLKYSPEDLTHHVAQAIALLPGKNYLAMLRGISKDASGLAPFFRIFTPKDLQHLGQFEIRGWFTSKEFEVDSLSSQSYAEWTESRKLPLMDRPFVPLLAMQHLKVLRTWGPAVLDTLLEVGRCIRDIGYSEDPKTFHGFVEGLSLVDGSKAKIPPHIAVLMAFYRHEAWIEERERSFRYDSPELRRPHRSEHVRFDPRVIPDEVYLPDLKKAYGFVHSLALWEEHPSPLAKDLLKKLFDLSTPNINASFNTNTLATLVATENSRVDQSSLGDWKFEPHPVAEERGNVSSLATLRPIPMTVWSTLIRASGITMEILPKALLRSTEQQVEYLTELCLERDRMVLAPVFRTLDSLDCFPLEMESRTIIEQLKDIATHRKALAQAIVVALLSDNGSHQPDWVISPQFDLDELLERITLNLSEPVGLLARAYRDKLSTTLTLYGNSAGIPMFPTVTLDNTSTIIPSLQEIIKSRTVRNGGPPINFRGGITDNCYTEMLLSEYVMSGNHLITQRLPPENSNRLDGAFLFGAPGVIPTELAPLVRILDIGSGLSVADLAVTAHDRRPGTYKRLFRSMAAHVALEGGTASLGLVHEQNRPHIELLEASGHTILRGIEIPTSNIRTAEINRYIPALLVISR